MAASRRTPSAGSNPLRELSGIVILDTVVPDGSLDDGTCTRVGYSTTFERECITHQGFACPSSTYTEIVDPTTPGVDNVQSTHDAHDDLGHPRRRFSCVSTQSCQMRDIRRFCGTCYP